MAKFKKPNGGGGDKEPPKPQITHQIKEPKCKVCKHKQRNQIDYLLAMKTPYKELERLFGIPYRSFSNHDKEHLGYENEGIKRVIEYEAGIAQENLAEGVKGAFLRRAALDTSIKKFFDALIAGSIPVEAKDVVKMIEIREKLDSDTAAAQIEQYELQFNAFKQAIEETVTPEMLTDILEKVKAHLQMGDRPALQPPRE